MTISSQVEIDDFREMPADLPCAEGCGRLSNWEVDGYGFVAGEGTSTECSFRGLYLCRACMLVVDPAAGRKLANRARWSAGYQQAQVTGLPAGPQSETVLALLPDWVGTWDDLLAAAESLVAA